MKVETDFLLINIQILGAIILMMKFIVVIAALLGLASCAHFDSDNSHQWSYWISQVNKQRGVNPDHAWAPPTRGTSGRGHFHIWWSLSLESINLTISNICLLLFFVELIVWDNWQILILNNEYYKRHQSSGFFTETKSWISYLSL